MAKIKAKQHGYGNIVTVKFSAGEEFAPYELNIIANNNNFGLMNAIVVNNKKIEYSANNCISLFSFLSNGVNSSQFINVILRLTDIFYFIESKRLNPYNICLDLSNIFINPTNGLIYFVYIPVNVSQFQNDFTAIYHNLIQVASMQDDSVKRALFTFLQTNNFDVSKMLNFIETAIPGIIEQTSFLNLNNSGMPHINDGPGTTKADSLNMDNPDETVILKDNIAETQNDANKHLGGIVQYSSPSFDDTIPLEISENFSPELRQYEPTAQQQYEPQTLRQQQNAEYEPNISFNNNGWQSSAPFGVNSFGSALSSEQLDATVPLDDMMDATVPLDIPEFPIVNKQPQSEAFITFVKSNEKYSINIPEFKVGADQIANNAVINNINVSRRHATILFETGKYYIIDENSTNGTYVNGNKIEPMMPVMLNSGDEIILANYTVKFEIVEDNA